MGLGGKEVRVPNTQKATEDWNVVLQRCSAEMLVHLMGTCQKFVEVVVANVKCHAEPNGTPDRVTSAYPALKAEHILAVDTELGNLGLVCRQCDEMLGNLALVASLLQ